MSKPETSNPTDSAYEGAPSLANEISWVLRSALDCPRSRGVEREFWLRKAVLIDRIALREEAMFGPDVAAEAVAAANRAARQLAEYDAAYGGLSFRGEELATDDDFRAYVRREYRARRFDLGRTDRG